MNSPTVIQPVESPRFPVSLTMAKSNAVTVSLIPPVNWVSRSLIAQCASIPVLQCLSVVVNDSGCRILLSKCRQWNAVIMVFWPIMVPVQVPSSVVTIPIAECGSVDVLITGVRESDPIIPPRVVPIVTRNVNTVSLIINLINL